MMRLPQSIRVPLTGCCRAVIRPAAIAALAFAFSPIAAHSFPLTGGWNDSAVKPFVAVDWQPPSSLPPRFRNHCRYDPVRGRPYCANHCGPDYQFYFCSPESFGCCHPGYGYCDWKGHLRCAP
jgi:hypothetical protein